MSWQKGWGGRATSPVPIRVHYLGSPHLSTTVYVYPSNDKPLVRLEGQPIDPISKKPKEGVDRQKERLDERRIALRRVC